MPVGCLKDQKACGGEDAPFDEFLEHLDWPVQYATPRGERIGLCQSVASDSLAGPFVPDFCGNLEAWAGPGSAVVGLIPP
jgi:hypothetical protein